MLLHVPYYTKIYSKIQNILLFVIVTLDMCLTFYVQMDFSFCFDTINLGWLIV